MLSQGFSIFQRTIQMIFKSVMINYLSNPVIKINMKGIYLFFTVHFSNLVNG